MRVSAVMLLILGWTQFALGQFDRHGFTKVPLTHNYNTLDYNGGIQNWDIAQDPNGLIYVANNFGLLEYDGENWRNYEFPGSTRTLSIYISKEGKIFTGGQNQFGYFEKNKQGILEFTSLKDEVPDSISISNIWEIHEYEGSIFFNSDKLIFKFTQGKLELIPFHSSLSLIFQTANRLFLHLQNQGIFEWRGDTFQLMPGTENMGSYSIVDVLPSNDGSLLFFAAEGMIFRYSEGKTSEWNQELFVFLRSALINNAVLLKDNSIAIGTQNNGLVILSAEGTPRLHLSMNKGLNSNTVLAMYEDQFSNLWVGLNNGITMIELGSPFSIINQAVGISGTGYTATLFNGEIYLGTNTGLYYQASPKGLPLNSLSEYNLVDGSEGQVYSIAEVNEKLWLGHHRGAFLVEKGKARNISNDPGTWKYATTPGRDAVVAGTYRGFQKYDLNGNKITDIAGLDESSRLFEFENDSVLWMSHGYKGAFRLIFDKGFNYIKSSKLYGQGEGFPSNLLINVFRLGNKLVFTGDNGVFRYDEGSDRFVHYEDLEEIIGADRHYSNISMDIQGNIYYIIHNQAVGLLENSSFKSYEKRENIFRRINKYISDDLENISILDHENVLIGAKEGFIHYNPTIRNQVIQDFKTYLRSLRIQNNDSLIFYGSSQMIGDVSLDSELSSLSIEFSSPYFDGLEEIEYQFFLEGLDKDWSDWSVLSNKEYTHLPEGNYIFHVRARNIYDQISEEAIFSFEIYPPWYASRLAISTYIVVILLLFFTLLLWIDLRHRKDKRIMELSSQREILEKDRQIQDVSEQSSLQIAELRAEKLRAEVDHMNKELASSTMHLLNKNEMMLSIKTRLLEIAKESSYGADLKRIIRSIEKNIHDDENWEQFTQHFDQVHGDFLKRLKEEFPDITPQETRLAAYLRMNLSSKNIAQLTNISVRGVEISRYRLRKKMKLDREVNLTSFLMDY